MKSKYQVGIYCRVSREDGDKPESDSIVNQKHLCTDFLKSNPELSLYNVYEDDGYTGVNFERPNFLLLMDDIKNKKINCIVVKDLSRFGRNWIEMGKYIQHIFPCLGIRFIAINDNYDSFNSDADTTGLILPMRNLMNETYAGDISLKIRSSFEVKRKNGEYVGPFVPYGYKRSKEDKHQLIIDESAANVVRTIFSMFIKGFSLSRISEWLNEHSIPSPMEYKRAEGSNFTTVFKKNLRAKWSPVAVKRVLINEVYIGDLVQGKKGTVNYKDKVVKVRPEEEWIRAYNTHEPIISKSDFELVQKLLLFDTRIAPEQENLYLFSGVLFCGDCKQNMVRRTVKRGDKKYFYYRCSTHKKNKHDCTQHNMSESKIYDTVLTILKQHIENVAELEEILAFIDGLPQETHKYKKINDEIERLSKEIESKQRKKQGLYDDLKDGLITKDDFTKFYDSYENDIAELEISIERYNVELEALESNSHYVWMDEFKSYRNITELNREIIINLIDKIYVYEDKRIEIKYNYSIEYAAVMDYISAFKSFNEEAAM